MEREVSAVGREVAAENGGDEVIVAGVDGGVAEHQKGRHRRVGRRRFGEGEGEVEEEDEGKMGNRRVWVALIHVSSGSAELNWRRATA